MTTTNAATVPIGVGIDTGRYGHHASFLNEEKRTASKEFHFTEQAAGYQKFKNALTRLAKKHGDVHFHIRVDAAGQYATNLLDWLHGLDFNCTISVGQPESNKAYRKVHYNKRKADPVESLACARFAIVERPEGTPRTPPELLQLRDLVAMLESAAKQETRLTNQLHALLARVFPEFAVHVRYLGAKWVLALLDQYPTPQKLARAKRSSLASIMNVPEDLPEELLGDAEEEVSAKRRLPDKLQQAAKETTGSSGGELAEVMVRRKVREIRNQQADSAELRKLLEKAWNALAQGPYKRLSSIPGIGILTASALVAKIVSIDRFAKPSALVGYFGVFPEEVDVSGVDRNGNPKKGTVSQMSRKGNDQVRRLLFTAAQAAVRFNPAVRALFARLSASGKHYMVCMGHCMAKLLRQVFAIWTKDCDFDPEFESKQTNEQAKDQADAAPTKEEKVVVGHSVKAVEPQEVVTTTTSTVAQPAVAGKQPPLNFKLLREQLSIMDVLRQLRWRQQSSNGAQLRGACPLHEELGAASRCFAVEMEKNVYCCHQCGSEGNALDLWVAHCGKPFLEASWELLTAIGMSPPLKEGPPDTK